MSDQDLDEIYFDPPRRRVESFDAELLREPLTALMKRSAIVFGGHSTVTEAMRSMQRQHRGCVLVTDDGTDASKLIGIFTERDVLFRIVDKGRNPAALPLSEVMTSDPETLSVRSSVAYALNKARIVKLAYRGLAQAATTPVPPTLKSHHKGIQDRTRDAEKAKALLREAGYRVP